MGRLAVHHSSSTYDSGVVPNPGLCRMPSHRARLRRRQLATSKAALWAAASFASVSGELLAGCRSAQGGLAKLRGMRPESC